jgi:hypothetical protein
MSAWNPIKSGDHVGIRRIWNCYGRPTAVADVISMLSLDGFDFVVFAVATFAPGDTPHTASAKVKTLAMGKVVGASLAKMVRNDCERMARRKSSIQARANMTLGIEIEKGGAK